MAYYDPRQQALSANIFAAQTGMQLKEAEEEKDEKREAWWNVGKAGYFLDRGYTQDIKNEVASMMLERDQRTSTGGKYKRKEFEKPKSWKEYFKQRYAKAGDRVELQYDQDMEDKQVKETLDLYRKSKSNPNTQIPPYTGSPLQKQRTMQSTQNKQRAAKGIKAGHMARTRDEIEAQNKWAQGLHHKLFKKNVADERIDEFMKPGRLQNAENLETISNRWGFGNQQPFGKFRSVKGMQLPDDQSSPPNIGWPFKESTQKGLTLKPGADEAGFAAAPSSYYTDLKEMPLAAYKMGMTGEGPKTPFLRRNSWEPTEAKIQRGTPTYPGRSIPKSNIAPALEEVTALQNYGPLEDLKSEQLEQWLEAGGKDLPGKSGMGKYDNWFKGQSKGLSKDTAGAAGEAVGETVSEATGDSLDIGGEAIGATATGVKVGMTLLGSKGQTNEQLLATGVETGLDVASSAALRSGNPYLMAVGGAYKLYDFL